MHVDTPLSSRSKHVAVNASDHFDHNHYPCVGPGPCSRYKRCTISTVYSKKLMRIDELVFKRLGDPRIFVALHYPRNWIGSVPMDVNLLRSLHMHVHWSHIYAIGGYWIVRLGLQHIFKRCNGYVFSKTWVFHTFWRDNGQLLRL